jgi:prepilin-type N-terminal cleavage/methylation domain-containing protein/prepilin-type processing-associated H-X9-DG protein
MVRVLPRGGMTLLECIVVIAIIGVLLALLIPAVHRVRETANAAQCKSNMRQIGLALHHYHDTEKTLPAGLTSPGGKGAYGFMGWHTRILPYVEGSALWSQAVEAYSVTQTFQKSPPHILDRIVSVYECPSDPRTGSVADVKGTKVALTSYLGVEGTNQFRHDGMLYLDSHTRLGDVKDGLSNTLMVGERPPSADLRLGWWYAGMGQNQDGSAEMVLGVRERNFGTWSGVCPPGPYMFGPGRMSQQCDAFHFWSPHLGGGAHFLFADGSVRFLSYSANSILPALATRAGGEAVAAPE